MFQTQALTVDNKKVEQIGQLEQLETLENYVQNSQRCSKLFHPR